MGVKTGLAFASLLAIGCVTASTPDTVAQFENRATIQAGATTCNQSICDTVCANGKNMKVTLTAYLACFNYLLCSCGPQPSPVPPEPSVGGQTATGGATSTGGTVSGGSGGKSGTVDGFALCVASTKANTDRQRQAADNGISISSLATSLCEPFQVRQCYASGVCQ
jgi:hypothetical protein